jgi:hypothetical protein
VPAIPVIQPSFAAGELSPFLYGRVDLAKFHVGARTMLNMFVHPHGGASNRPGTRFIGEVDDSSKRHRLIDFKFRASPGGQNYALVFGDKTMQVVMFNPSGALGAGGTWGFVESSPGVRFTLATPYAAADLPTLKYVQSADTMTLTHPNYAPRKLTRSGHAAWTLTQLTFAPSTPAPTNLAASSPGSAVNIVVTAINDANGEESLPGAPAGSTTATDGWSWTAVAGCTNYNVYKQKGSIYGFVAQVTTNSWTDATFAPDIGNTPPQQRNPFGLGKITAVTIQNGGGSYNAPTVRAVDRSGTGATFTAHISGGVITSVDVNTQGKNYSGNTTLQISDGSGSGAVIQLNWQDDGTDGLHFSVASATVLAGGASYSANAYAVIVAPEGYTQAATLSLTIGGGAVTAATVTNAGSGYFWNFTAPYVVVYDSAGSGAVLVPTVTPDQTTFPQCSTYYMQRQAFAGTLALPQTLWFSVTGAFNNMSVSQPTKDDDAITRALTSRQVNEIRHLVPGVSLLVMTSGAEWRCWPGPSAQALTPGSCTTLPQSAYGCSHVPPIQAGQSVLFVQERGSRVRELRFDVLQDQYQAADMSVLAQHLLYDTSAQYQIQEWAFAEEPFRVVWCVRSDGTLLGFTFMREHEVYAWHRHTTDGIVESVASIPETEPSTGSGQAAGALLDAVYLIVNRTIGGVTRRYVERMVARQFATIADAWFVDCALQYSGAPVTSVSGLTHLIGKTVAILGDGSVVPSQVVDNTGTVRLDGPYSKVTVGLPYTADLVTLDLELPSQGGTVQGQPKKIAQATLRVKDARGIQAGIEQEVPMGAASGSAVLVEIKQRSMETLGSPMQPYSGDFQVAIPTEWNRGGRLFVRQGYPLPCTVLAIVPEVSVGD